MIISIVYAKPGYAKSYCFFGPYSYCPVKSMPFDFKLRFPRFT